jgi:hypothetical protein
LIFTAFLTEPNNQFHQNLPEFGANRRESASYDEKGCIGFSFFVHVSFAFRRRSLRLVLHFCDSASLERAKLELAAHDVQTAAMARSSAMVLIGLKLFLCAETYFVNHWLD